MRFTSRALLAVAVLAIACTAVHEPTAPLPSVRSTDYALYDVVLDSLFPSRERDTVAMQYVLGDSTMRVMTIPDSAQFAEEIFGALLLPVLRNTMGSYRERNAVAMPLEARAFHTRAPVRLLSRHDLAQFFLPRTADLHAQWAAYYERFPGARGYITFSRPGYDADSSHALLSYGHSCGALCGDGGFVILERHGDAWVLLRRLVLVRS